MALVAVPMSGGRVVNSMDYLRISVSCREMGRSAK